MNKPFTPRFRPQPVVPSLKPFWIMGLLFLAVVLTAALMSGCAALAPKTDGVVCQNAPQWTTANAQGVPVTARFVCFSNDGHLVYRDRLLTPAEVTAYTQAAEQQRAAAAADAAAAQRTNGSADPCTALTGDAYTRCRIQQRASAAPGTGLQPAPAPKKAARKETAHAARVRAEKAQQEAELARLAEMDAAQARKDKINAEVARQQAKAATAKAAAGPYADAR